MAAAAGKSSPALIPPILEQYARFDVFQLVRLLCHRHGGAWPIGQRLRFRADLSAAFPGREITHLSRARPMPAFRNEVQPEQKMPERIEVRTSNYCVASELGPLPEPFLEWVRDQERLGGHAMAAFLDIFNQRIHVLRHDLKMRALRALDGASPAQTRYAGQLAALMGMALPAQQAQMPLPMRAWLGLAGLLANSRKSAIVIGRILSAYLGVGARLEPLVGAWRDIETTDRLALGRHNHALGQRSLLGRRTWDAHAGVRLIVDRLPYAVCCALLPLREQTNADGQAPGTAHRGLVAMIHLLLDRHFDCEVCLNIDPDTVPPSSLRPGAGSEYRGLRLGHTAWLGGKAGRMLRFRVSAQGGEEAMA
jgi:type VI secretion system protein ImpH